MNIFDFTAEEMSLIAIYATASRATTIEQIVSAQSHMDGQMQAIAAHSAAKLVAMSDNEFKETVFELES